VNKASAYWSGLRGAPPVWKTWFAMVFTYVLMNWKPDPPQKEVFERSLVVTRSHLQMVRKIDRHLPTVYT